MSKQELIQKILSWINRTDKEMERFSEPYRCGAAGVLVDDIEALCKEQAEARAHNLLVRYAEKREVTIKTDCPDCHTLMEGTWSGEPPYTIVCSVCGQSYTLDIERSHDLQP